MQDSIVLIIVILYLTSGRVSLPTVFFRNFLAISVYFLFQMNFRLNMSSSIKNPFGILIGSALNLQINLGRIDIFTLLNLPIQEHGMPLHFFRCSFISFSKVLMVFFFHVGLKLFLLGLFLGISQFCFYCELHLFFPFTFIFQVVIASIQEISWGFFFFFDVDLIYLVFK